MFWYVVEVGGSGKYRKRVERHTWQGSIGRRAVFQAIQQQPPPERELPAGLGNQCSGGGCGGGECAEVNFVKPVTVRLHRGHESEGGAARKVSERDLDKSWKR